MWSPIVQNYTLILSDKNAGGWARRWTSSKELQLAAEEDKRGQDRLTELIEKLQQKIKTYKHQVEEAVSYLGLKLWITMQWGYSEVFVKFECQANDYLYSIIGRDCGC